MHGLVGHSLKPDPTHLGAKVKKYDLVNKINLIIFIDLILAGDNAIIIGMVASKFPLEQRRKIIFWGIGGAVVLRIILTLLA